MTKTFDDAPDSLAMLTGFISERPRVVTVARTVLTRKGEGFPSPLSICINMAILTIFSNYNIWIF